MGLMGFFWSSLAPPIGIQYRRRRSPIGVFGPTWVRRRFFSALSTLTSLRFCCNGRLFIGISAGRNGGRHLARISHHCLPGDRAAIHLVFEPLHRWPRIVPGQPRVRRPAPHDLIGEKWIEIVHGVDLRRRGIRPTETEHREPPLELAQYIAGLFAHRLRAGLAVANDPLAVACAALPSLGAACDHETRSGIPRSDRE